MVIEGEHGSVELETRRTEAGGYPGTVVRVRVRCGEFSGANEAIWIALDALQTFLADLRLLERTRRGEAVLTSMSPGELRLRVYAVDRAGHLAVEATVGVGEMGAHEWQGRSVACSFPLDPSQLPGVLHSVAWLSSALSPG